MKVCEVWAVAADYIIKKNRFIHFKEITNYILENNLTTLGEEGKDPSQTVGSTLRTKKIDGKYVFDSGGEGTYQVPDEELIKDQPEIKLVSQMLERKDKIDVLKSHIISLENSIPLVKKLYNELFDQQEI